MDEAFVDTHQTQLRLTTDLNGGNSMETQCGNSMDIHLLRAFVPRTLSEDRQRAPEIDLSGTIVALTSHVASLPA
jgi:hypothetical protein